MPLTPGTRLGVYDITAQIGVGGMGEVYRARDTRLDRTVAIKVLPAALGANPQFRERLEREARMISQLAHPHICALHDVGEQDGVQFLVLEYLEGETLATRLERGPLKGGEALQIAVDLLDALDCAHRLGIVHRDFKPGNIMLTRDGAKLLDFGLATWDPASAAAALALTAADLTAPGTIVGTLRYMSPEQLEGKETDARSDIFAVGAVLFEMVTGTKAFAGSSTASVIAAILSSEPAPSLEWAERIGVSEWIVKRCLAKNPDERWQTTADLGAVLRSGPRAATVGAGQAPANSSSRAVERRWLPWLVAGALGLVALVLTLWDGAPAPAPPPAFTFVVQPPENTSFDIFQGRGSPAMSPDGLWLAFAAARPEGVDLLWIRSLDRTAAAVVAGSEGASGPFWSPDSRQVAFFAGGALKKVVWPDGVVQGVAENVDGVSGAWGRDGTIVVASKNGHLRRIAAGGGGMSAVGPTPVGDESSASPAFLPDGSHFLYHFTAPGQEAGIYVGSLSGSERTFITKADSGAVFSSGRLIFVRGADLLAQPFDPMRLTLAGEPSVISRDVQITSSGNSNVFATSAGSTLAFRTGGSVSRLAWFDRQGRRAGSVTSDGASYRNPMLTADGTRIVVERTDVAGGTSGLWLIDLVRGVSSRLTRGPARSEAAPVWSPDGTRVVYMMQNSSLAELNLATQVTTRLPFVNFFTKDWSSDGRFLLGEMKSDLWTISMTGSAEARPVVAPASKETDGRFSPNGRWIAYSSDGSGRYEVFIAPFGAAGPPVQVSTKGGLEAAWRRDGKELFYLGLDRTLMAVAFDERDPSHPGVPRPLFEMPTSPLVDARNHYDVDPDGQRFLVTEEMPGAHAPGITVMTNWLVALKK